MRFVYENGKYRAHFKNMKNKNFRMADDEWSGEKSTLAYNEKRNLMKPYYFLSQAEAQNVWQVVDQDTSTFTPFMKDYTNLQRALDFMQNQEQKTSDPSTFLESDSKGIWDKMNKRFLASEEYWSKETSYSDGNAFPKEGQTYGLNTQWDSYVLPGRPGLPSIHELNAGVITRKMNTLNATRKLAAESSGVDWRVYNDFAKDMPVAGTYDTLKNQYTVIANYQDRNDLQKQYLQEKAGVRYLMGVSNHFGYGADLHDVLFESAGPVTMFDQERLIRKAAVLGGTRNFITNADIMPEHYFKQNDEGVKGWQFAVSKEDTENISALTETPAWVNKGETPLGWLDLADWQKEAEKDFVQADSSFRQGVIEEVGYDPEVLIEHNGVQTKAINVARELERTTEDIKKDIQEQEATNARQESKQ